MVKDEKRMNYGFVEVKTAEILDKLIADGPKKLGEVEIPVARGSNYF